MAKAKEIRDATQAKLKDVLTSEQMDKFQKFMQQHRPMGGHGNNGGGDKSGNDKPANPPQQ